MGAFFAEQHVKRDAEFILLLEQANKLAQELIDRKKELKAVMFGNKLLSFIPNADASLGKLVYTTIKVTSKTRGITENELDQIDVSAAYDFVPLENARPIANFGSCEQLDDSTAQLTQMPIDSELTIREHCFSLLKKSDILREITIEYIRKAFNTCPRPMPETDGSLSPNECTEQVVEQQAFLQGGPSSDEESLPSLAKALNELSDLEKDLMSTMSGKELLSLVPSGDASFGKLVYTYCD